MLTQSMRVSPGVRAAAILWGVAVLCGLAAAAIRERGDTARILSRCFLSLSLACWLAHFWMFRRRGEAHRDSVAAKLLTGAACRCLGLMGMSWAGRGRVINNAVGVLLLCFAAHRLWGAMRAIVRSR